jgi:hypothetical protein
VKIRKNLTVLFEHDTMRFVLELIQEKLDKKNAARQTAMAVLS